jgi:hypothetical protein
VCLLVGLFGGKPASRPLIPTSALPKRPPALTYDANRKAWHSADFRSDKKFAISRSKTKAYAWEAKEVGDARPAATCEKDFNEAGNLFCSGVFDLRFNRRQLRFLYAYPIGYWSDGAGAREGENTPAMAIGRCREL